MQILPNAVRHIRGGNGNSSNSKPVEEIHFDGNQRFTIQQSKIRFKELYSQDSSVDKLYNLLVTIQPKRKQIKKQIKQQKLDRSSIKN